MQLSASLPDGQVEIQVHIPVVTGLMITLLDMMIYWVDGEARPISEQYVI